MGGLKNGVKYSTPAIFTKPTKLLWGVSQTFQLNSIFSALSKSFEKINSIFSALSKSFEKIKTFSVPLCYSATLHPSGKWLVTGGDDFKLYKFDYEEEKEVGELSKLSVFS